MTAIIWFLTGLILGIMIIYTLLETKNQQSSSKELLNGIIRILVRQCARWSTAAQQDQNPMIAILHANYGAGYLWALKDIATDQQVYSASGVNMQQFTQHVVQIQDQTTKKMASVCPQFAPKQTYLSKLAGESS